MHRRALGLLLLLTAVTCASAFAQSPEDTRTQYPAWLANSYFSVNVGSLQKPFTQRQLEPGFHATSIDVPHVAARVTLFGHELTPRLSVQLTYMRPVHFVIYRDVNGDGGAHSVWTGFGGATLKGRAPIAGRVSVYGEAGLGITSRHGFNRDAAPVVRDTSYASILLGAGVEYRLRPTWDVAAGATYIPANGADRESRAVMVDGGFRYTMRPLPRDRVDANRDSGYIFRARRLQVEYSTGLGYAINTFLSTRLPVFWKGEIKVDRGIAVHYDQNVFHTRKIFALDVGISASDWRTREARAAFSTLSVYPLFRFLPVRTKKSDVYVCYSLAGPTYISTRRADGRDLGSHFTFQDFMGAGVLVGKARTVALGVKINHYSNGNVFPENAGVMIPVTLTAGWAF